MARSQLADFIHSMRFHVVAGQLADGSNAPIQAINPDAGFSACTTPEATVEVVEYKEGQFLYTRKYPGHVTYNDVTMSRGVARTDSSFWEWIRIVIEGNGEYRSDVQIKHFHRSDVLPGALYTGAQTVPTLPPAENLNLTAPAKIYTLYQALPVRHKFAGDLDATDSAISIMELDVSYEHCLMVEP